MESGWYELRSGRHVWLQQLLIRRSAIGIYMGKKDAVRRRVLEGLPDDVRRMCGQNTGVVVKEPPPETLPRYVLIAEFSSPTSVRQGFDCSALAVCWFSDAIAVDPEILREQVCSVDWEAEARDGNY
jgi:hypothetical protein